jgi:ligand-binding sensor domain-containing protein
MFRDGQGNLWFGGDSGLLIWYNGEWGGTIVEPLSSELLQGRRGRIPHFLEDSTGRLWVGIGSSLSERSYGDETFEELEFPDQSINALLESSDGTLWIGTSHGVIRLKSPTSN